MENLSEFEFFLLKFHTQNPGCTSIAFANGKTKEGLSSYEKLSHLLPKAAMSPLTVLDIACGDGYLLKKIALQDNPLVSLIGLDFSSVELAEAKKQLRGFPINLIEGKAQDIPLKDSSVDFIFCHMAFMLMDDIEKVVQEIHRILKPGGSFSAIIGSEKRGEEDPLNSIFLNLLSEAQNTEGKRWQMRVGDKRIATIHGIRALFSSKFRNPVTFEKFRLIFSTTPQDAVQFFLLMYDVALLSSEGQNRLGKELYETFNSKTTSLGNVEFYSQLQQITVTKESPERVTYPQ